MSPNCSKYYTQVSHPNMINHWTKEEASISFQAAYLTPEFYFDCYQHFVETSCYIFFPRCNSTSNSIIIPCREAIEELLKGCFDSFTQALHNPFDFDVDYLPAKDGPIVCSYVPVVCAPPQHTNTSNVFIKNRNNTGIFLGGTVVQYACLDELKFKRFGPKTRTCLASGRWSGVAPRCKTYNYNSGSSVTAFLSVVLLIIFIIVFVIVLTVIVYRQGNSNLTRTRYFDALICCHFDSDNDFVLETLLPELEEKDVGSRYKLCVHFRDFKPGRKVTQNIREAIDNSNSTIILLSQGFVESKWCQEEFEECYAENKKDPAFLMLVIMMQEAKTLVNVPECMAKLIKQDTYLEKDDPDLIKKISKCLTGIKKEKGTDTNHTEGEQEEEEVEEAIAV